MNYFRQSLISIPSYIPNDIYRPDFSLFNLQDIFNELVLPHDRRELNRIYQQADISNKRNSIITINNKRQKKIISNSLGTPNLYVPNKSNKDQIHPQYQILGRQNAFFQQVHPTDVDKTYEENIFDYRLHLKLARGQQIFKVEQLKRKTKKRNTAGKQCECCGKEVMKNHRCQHTFCEQKCGKVIENIKKSNIKKDLGSSISDSKDQNWSDENIDQQKNGKQGNLNRKQSDKKSKLNRRQSILSNKQQFGEPSQLLLASIEKLLMFEENNFTYKVLEIKEYPSEDEDDENRQNQYEQKDLDLDDSENKRLYEEDDMRDEEIEEKIESEKQQRSHRLGINDLISGYSQEKGITFSHSMFDANYPIKIETNNGPNTLKKNFQSQQIESKNKNKQVGQKNIHQNQRQSTGESTQTNKNQSQTKQQNHILSNPQINKGRQVQKKINVSRSPHSDSQSESNKDKVLEQSEVVQIKNDNYQKNKSNHNLKSSEYQMVDDGQKSEEYKKSGQQDKSQVCESVPSIQQQNSLDDEIDDIIDPQVKTYPSNSYSLNRNYSTRPFEQSSQKISKKQSKNIKIIQKKILLSQKIQEIDPISDLDEEYSYQAPQEQHEQITEKDQRFGRGKGRGMGKGKGIFEEQLNNYQEKSQLLEDQDLSNSKQESDQSNFQYQRIRPTQRARKFPKSEYIISESNIKASSSPRGHPLTPKRSIPDMQKIIEQIKNQSQKQIYQKGLGRGKVFGWGLGVLEQTEELEKQVEKDGLHINHQNQSLQISKRLNTQPQKTQQPNPTPQEQYKQSEDQDQPDSDQGEQDFCDKFQQLIEEDQDMIPENMCLNKSSSIDKLQAVYYKHYLQKRVSVAVGACENCFDEEVDDLNELNAIDVQDDSGQLKKQQNENFGQINSGKNNQSRSTPKDDNRQGPELKQRQSSEIYSRQEQQLDSMINLDNNNQEPLKHDVDD